MNANLQLYKAIIHKYFNYSHVSNKFTALLATVLKDLFNRVVSLVFTGNGFS